MAGIVLDASVLIGLYDSQDAHHSWCVDFLTQSLDSDLLMAGLTYAEVMVRPAQSSRLLEFTANTAGLDIRVLDSERGQAAALAHLRAETGLRMPDAVVLHSAIVEGAELATCDSRLATIAKRQGLTVYTPAA